jgi:hypothetical protein
MDQTVTTQKIENSNCIVRILYNGKTDICFGYQHEHKANST